ncbi:hypothetical protein BHF71_02355 [Vulcanibacillus modesticaldus]|uniref:YhaN AAA domain-containing protein n=1 Tax=Vulcanibacillus modesticaldus TaxID=337097 RepID=A0A1D2YTN4_9BACI|nr:AAA family ATPase [Vulcanibacillus modesticaldus]OEF99047.1 hypothetical protein BHF71_02355 [Vulcanibacillus modesticaldus]
MIIHSIDIYGFGKLNDLQITLNKGINVIEGLNEAGKSTIMAFISSIFFGFEGKKKPHLRYEPIHGGKFGGAIKLIDEEQKIYKIERIYYQKTSGDVKIYLPNGEIVGESFLPNILGKINEKVFKQIFCFGLTELQQIDSLKDQQINDFLYHSGTGSVIQILNMKKQLEQNKQKLFKSSGKKPEINLLLAKIDSTKQGIERLKEKHGQHQSIVNRIRESEIKILEIDRKVEKKKEVLEWLRKIKQYLESFQRIKEIESKIKEYPKNFQFPENGVERLQSILEKINELEIELGQLKIKKDEVELEINKLQIDPFYEENQLKIIQLKEQLNYYQDQKRAYQSLKLELKNIQENIETKLNELGSPFTEDRVKDIKFSLNDKQHLQEISNQLQIKQEQLNDLKIKIDLKRDRQLNLKKAIQKLKQEIDSIKRNNQIDEIFPLVKNYWERLKENELEYRQLSQQKQVYLSQLKSIKNTNLPKSLYLINGFFFISSLMLIFFKLWAYGGLIFGFSVLMLIILSLNKNNAQKSLIKTIKYNIFILEQQLTNIQQEIEMIQTKALEHIKPFGFAKLDERTFQQLEELRIKNMHHEHQTSEKTNRVEEYNLELEQLEIELEQLEAVKKPTLTAEINALKQSWEDWMNNHNLPNDLSSLIVFDIMAVIQSTKDLVKERDNIIGQLEKINLFIKDFEDEVKDLYQLAEIDPSMSTEENIYQLANQLKKNETAKINLQHLHERLEEVNSQIGKIAKRLEIEKEKYQALLKYANVSDQEEFYRQARLYEQYQMLTAEKQQLLLAIKSSCKNESQYKQLLNDLQRWERGDLVNKIEDLNQELRERLQEIKNISEEKGQLQNQLREMEEDFTLSELNQKYAVLVSELSNKVKEWLAYSLAKHTLEKTMKVYEMEKQPQVLQRASEYFACMTDNQYVKVLAPIESNSLEVIRNDGVRFQPQFLSRGTIEQLFLAMRFALVGEFAKQMVLPIILDDIFVNFDSHRLANAIKTLEKLSADHQIILFTCHPHISSLIKQTTTEGNLIKLN